VQSIVIIEGV